MAGVLEDEAPLRFDVATSLLKSLLATAKQSPSGQVLPEAIFEVLQKLQLSISRTERAIIKAHQRRAEDALVDIILKGTAAPVSLVSSAAPDSSAEQYLLSVMCC